MKLFALPDGAIDRRDRAQWLTCPFDLAFASTLYDEVLASCQAHFRANAALQAALSDGKLWAEAPESTLLPYATFFLVSEEFLARTTGAPAIRSSTVQFNLHATTRQAARALGGLFESAYDRQSLPAIAGYQQMVAQVVRGSCELGLGKGPRGKDCHVQTMDLEIWHAKN